MTVEHKSHWKVAGTHLIVDEMLFGAVAEAAPRRKGGTGVIKPTTEV
jgi:hypothetical protein